MNDLLIQWIHNKYLTSRGKKHRLSEENVDRRKRVEYLDQVEKDLILQVERRLSNQDKLNKETQASSIELKAQVEAIQKNLSESLNELQNHNNSVTNTRQQLSAIEYRVQTLNQHRLKLDQAIKTHEAKGPDQISHVPYEFFNDLHKEHERILTSLSQQLEQAESLAKTIFQTPATANEPQDQPPLRAKVFEVCRMLFDQQKAVST